MRINAVHAVVALMAGLGAFMLPVADASAGGADRAADATKPSGYPGQRTSTMHRRMFRVGGLMPRGGNYGRVAGRSLRYGASSLGGEQFVAGGAGYAGDPYEGGIGDVSGLGGAGLFSAGGLFGPGTGPAFGGHGYAAPAYAVPTTVYQPVTRTYTVAVRSFRTVERTRYVPVTSYQPVTTAVQVPVTTYQTVQRTEQVPTLAYRQVCPPCDGCEF